MTVRYNNDTAKLYRKKLQRRIKILKIERKGKSFRVSRQCKNFANKQKIIGNLSINDWNFQSVTKDGI